MKFDRSEVLGKLLPQFDWSKLREKNPRGPRVAGTARDSPHQLPTVDHPRSHELRHPARAETIATAPVMSQRRNPGLRIERYGARAALRSSHDTPVGAGEFHLATTSVLVPAHRAKEI